MNGRDESVDPDEDFRLQGFDDFELKLGDIMRGERATIGKSLLDVQREIKIKASYIAAIEDTDLSAFETPGFIAGYVRSYARYLGMDPDWAFRSFCEESGFSHVSGLSANVERRPGGRAPRAAIAPAAPKDDMLLRNPLLRAPEPGIFAGLQPGAIGSLAVLIGLIGALGYGGWAVLNEIQRVTVTPAEPTIASAPVISVDEPSETEDEATEDLARLERLYRPQALDRPVVVPRDGPIATLDPREQGLFAQYAAQTPRNVQPRSMSDPAPDPVAEAIAASVSGTEEPAEPSEVQVVAPNPPQIVLFARHPAWVRVRSADGTVLFEKIMEEGERYVLPQEDQPPTLRAGNASALYVAVNGDALGPVGQGASIAKNVILSADSLSETYGMADLSEDPDLARMASLVAELRDEPTEPEPSSP